MIKIRKITPNDYKQAGDMIKRTIRASFKSLYPEKLIQAFCDKHDIDKFRQVAKTVEFFVAEDQKTQKIVGIIGIKDDRLRRYFVDPNYQGKGVGRLLFDHLEVVAKKRGLQKITLEGSPLAQPIYKHFGFKIIKSITKERAGVKYTDAVMEKTLKS